MFSIFKKGEGSLLDRLKQSVSKTRSQIVAKVEDLVSGEKKIDPALLTKLENVLLAADIGPRTTHQILEVVRQKLARHSLNTGADLKAELRNQLLVALRTLPPPNGASSSAQETRPHVIFVVGVNGTGKTTTIGKLAHRLRQDGRSVVLAAGDTFRAAAIEQLGVWASRTGAEIIKTKSGGDPAAVVYDALTSARARNADVVTGIVLTKLDGTAKGGIIVAITRELGLPVRYVGTGETVEDLVPFDAETFVSSLFD